jgi:hypothetical protein
MLPVTQPLAFPLAKLKEWIKAWIVCRILDQLFLLLVYMQPLFVCCSSTKQQLSIFVFPGSYLPKIVMKVVNPAAAYPMIYPRIIPWVQDGVFKMAIHFDHIHDRITILDHF